MRYTATHGTFGTRLSFAKGPVAALLDLLGLWYDRHCQRRRLTELTQDDLRDVGLSKREADDEASKPFWIN